MIWKPSIRRWLVTTIVLALAAGLLWAGLESIDRLDEAMAKAARQRELVP
jgi:hypothetical protein